MVEPTLRYIVVDLEATCWETRDSSRHMEIIEIGAVCLASSSGPIGREFAAFVKPVASPVLSEFCTQLTTIRQEDVDGAELFPAVLARFVAWIGEEPYRLVSWGAYDLNQFRKDCLRHGIPLPPAFENHINLKQEFSKVKNVRPLGMKAALALLNISLTGTHHRGIDDARNTALIAQIILPQLTT